MMRWRGPLTMDWLTVADRAVLLVVVAVWDCAWSEEAEKTQTAPRAARMENFMDAYAWMEADHQGFPGRLLMFRGSSRAEGRT